MQRVFYPGATSSGRMTIEVAIVYSQILYYAVCSHDEAFKRKGGKPRIPIVKDQDGESYVPFRFRVVSTMIDYAWMTRQHFYKIRDILIEKGYISKIGIKVDDDILKSYFELKTDAKTNNEKETPLRLIQCVVYSYLYDKTKKYGSVDKYNRKIAKILNIGLSTLGKVLAELKGLGLITSTNEVGKKSIIVAKYESKDEKQKDVPAPKPVVEDKPVMEDVKKEKATATYESVKKNMEEEIRRRGEEDRLRRIAMRMFPDGVPSFMAEKYQDYIPFVGIKEPRQRVVES